MGAEQSYADMAAQVAGYPLARTLVAGKTVLDVACGQGHGSRLMSGWGAASVTGVAADEEAVAAAQRAFGGDAVRFRTGDPQSLPQLFDTGSFDVVVAFDAITEVEDPLTMLRGLRHCVRDGGVVIVSCPNARWLAPQQAPADPAHRRQFTEAEFRLLATQALGEPDGWYRGTALNGFITFPADPAESDSRAGDTTDLTALVIGTAGSVHPDDCGHFVALWGASELAATAMTYPVDMQHSEIGVRRSVQQQLSAALSEIGRLQLTVRILQEENAIIRESQGLIIDHHSQEYQQALADQTVLIDERDAYIRSLEARVDAQQAELSALYASRAVQLRNRLPGRGRRDSS